MQVVNQRSLFVRNSFVTKAHLSAGNINHLAKMLCGIISDAEVWLSAFLQLSSYCLKHPHKGLIKSGCVRKD
jgi:hypothetical protein